MCETLEYTLPKSRIAQTPVFPRDACNLLVLRRDGIDHRIFADLADYVQRGDVLVLNKSRVLRARLFGTKETGGKLEFLIIGGTGEQYECLIKGKCREGTTFTVGDVEGVVLEKNGGRSIISLPLSMDEIECQGWLPTPP
jgi:S-adenosylmethionine:tRNA ribosyltransferase-isomerase